MSWQFKILVAVVVVYVYVAAQIISVVCRKVPFNDELAGSKEFACFLIRNLLMPLS